MPNKWKLFFTIRYKTIFSCYQTYT